jgi:hypothetical protein
MALPLFYDGLVEHLCLQALFGIHLLESAVFIFQLLHSDHHGHIHTAELSAPLVESGIAHAMFTAQLGYRRTGLGLLQDVDDLAIAIARSFHCESPKISLKKILLMNTSIFRGDYQNTGQICIQ